MFSLMLKHSFMFSLNFWKLHFVSQTKIFEVEEDFSYMPSLEYIHITNGLMVYILLALRAYVNSQSMGL
jgi:hypothetical protein